jgi:hypothetical protein
MDMMFDPRQQIDPRILNEVPFFKGRFIDSLNDPDTFHFYLNKINDIWKSILSSNFKRLVKLYNDEFLINKERQRKILLEMAAAYDVNDLDLSSMLISPDVNSLTRGLKSTSLKGIRKPRRRPK